MNDGQNPIYLLLVQNKVSRGRVRDLGNVDEAPKCLSSGSLVF